MFVVAWLGWLDDWTPLRDSFARDYVTLPKCGLAVRHGTDLYTSSADYPKYGPVGNGWLSHPLLCVTAGVPLSFLDPFTGYRIVNALYLVLHVWILVAFGRRLTVPYRARDYVIFAALGLFFPWYVMYVVGQYHALSVLALALVLLGVRRTGFVLSAVTKPVLAPAGVVLLARRHVREALLIALIAAAATLPFWTLLHQYFDIGADQAKLFVPGWDQQMSLALLLDQFVSPDTNLRLREIGAVALVLYAGFGLRRRPIELAIAVATLAFFVYYARGHEYHSTLLVPVFLYLWTLPGGRYRTLWMALLIVVVALPSPWPLFGVDAAFPDFDVLQAKSHVLFAIFLGQKPVAALLLIATVVLTEGVDLRPLRREDDVADRREGAELAV